MEQRQFLSCKRLKTKDRGVIFGPPGLNCPAGYFQNGTCQIHKVPGGGEQRLETIATLAVRLRETVRRLSEEWVARKNPVP